MLDKDFEKIYSMIEQVSSATAKNEAKARLYIDSCHKLLKVKLVLTVRDYKTSIFYLESDPIKKYEIDLMTAPKFSKHNEFISWAKSEIQKIETIFL